jgi:hypothetical protein
MTPTVLCVFKLSIYKLTTVSVKLGFGHSILNFSPTFGRIEMFSYEKTETKYLFSSPAITAPSVVDFLTDCVSSDVSSYKYNALIDSFGAVLRFMYE